MPEVNQNGPQNPEPDHVPPVVKALFFLFGGLAALLTEPSRALRQQCYNSLAGIVIGLGATLGAGVGLEFLLMQTYGFGYFTAAPWAIILSVLSYFYLGPILYLYVFWNVIEFSGKLWDKVPTPRASAWRRPSVGTQHNWFSWVLMVLFIASIVVGGAAYMFTGSPPVWLWVVLALAAVGSKWYVRLLFWMEMPLVAVYGCGALVAYYSPETAAYVEINSVGHWLAVHGLGQVAAFIAYALEFSLTAGFLFPLVHRLFSLAEPIARGAWNFIRNTVLDVYSFSERTFQESFLQVINIVAAVAAGYFAYQYSPVFGFTHLVDVSLTAGIAAFAALMSYVVLGTILMLARQRRDRCCRERDCRMVCGRRVSAI